MPKGPCDFKPKATSSALGVRPWRGLVCPTRRSRSTPRSGIIRLIPKGGKVAAVDEKGDEWDEAVAKLEGRPA